MALRGAVCRLLVNPRRCAIISACRTQGTAAPARWGKCCDSMQATDKALFTGTVQDPQISIQMVSVSFAEVKSKYSQLFVT